MAEYLWTKTQAFRLMWTILVTSAVVSLASPTDARAQEMIVPPGLTDADVFMYQCPSDDRSKVVIWSQVGETSVTSMLIQKLLSVSNGKYVENLTVIHGDGIEFKDGAWREVEQIRGGLDRYVEYLRDTPIFGLVKVQKFKELLNTWPTKCGPP